MAEPEGAGWVAPADGWLLVLTIEGALLLIGEAARLSILKNDDPGLLPFMVPGLAYLTASFFFAAALPPPHRPEPRGSLARRAELLLRLLPRPGTAVRGAALALCFVPFLFPPRDSWTASLIGGMAFTGALLLGSVARVQDTQRGLTLWDQTAPWCLLALTALHAAAGFSGDPWARGSASAGLAACWATHLLFLRQAAARHWQALASYARAPREAPSTPVGLGGYASSVERERPAAKAAPAPGPDGAMLVESGSFRIDADKMLEKLRERQLAEAGDFILAWLRCAVASGARVIDLGGSFNALRLSFDGRPFAEADLRDPYRVLLDGDGPEAVPGTQLAYGLLAVLRLEPASVWVLSGKGPNRVRFNLASRDAKGSQAPEEPWEPTVLHVVFRGPLGWWRAARARRRAAAVFGLCDATLRVHGTAVPDRFPLATGWNPVVRDDGGRYAWRPRPGEPASRVRVYHWGVLVEELEHPLVGEPQVEAALAEPKIRLNLSQSSAVRDAAFAEALRALAQASRTASPL